MKVNVILITYNQENYIRKAIDSILFQKTETFEVEIIVADDSSTDNTLHIIEEYSLSAKAPFSFLFLKKGPNLGYIKNYKRAFDSCTGKYVAIMEGDDYWHSPLHLQNHVSFLEKHSESSMSYNRHLRIFVDENREEILDWNEPNSFKYITTEHLALHDNCIGNFSCCVYRGELISKLDPRLFEMNIADWMMGMYMGQYGPIAFQQEVTSAYLIHSNGQWSRMTEEEKHLHIIARLEEYDKYFDYKYTKYFTRHKRRLEICLYGDKTLRGRIKRMTPLCIRKIYRKIFN